MKPDAPISAADPSAPIYAPEQSPIADSSRLTRTCTKRSSLSMVSIRSINQLSGSEATSFTSHLASCSAMRLPTSEDLSFMILMFPLVGCTRGAQCAPDGLGRDRQADVAHTEMPQRIDDRVADRRRRADRAALAAALDAERIARR